MDNFPDILPIDELDFLTKKEEFGYDLNAEPGFVFKNEKYGEDTQVGLDKQGQYSGEVTIRLQSRPGDLTNVKTFDGYNPKPGTSGIVIYMGRDRQPFFIPNVSVLQTNSDEQSQNKIKPLKPGERKTSSNYDVTKQTNAAPCCKQAIIDANNRWPSRNTASDGIIGDAAHQQRLSDHNLGNAVDITHDTVSGCVGDLISSQAITDKRVTYVIWDKQINSLDGRGWRIYNGDDPHTNHVHISIKANLRDDTNHWPWAPSTSQQQTGLSDDLLQKLVDAMVSVEGGHTGDRNIRDKNPGNLKYPGSVLGQNWLVVKYGATSDPDGFAIFSTMVDGYSAMKDLLKYYINQGKNLAQLISTWSTTDVDSYISTVSSKTGIGRNDVLKDKLKSVPRTNTKFNQQPIEGAGESNTEGGTVLHDDKGRTIITGNQIDPLSGLASQASITLGNPPTGDDEDTGFNTTSEETGEYIIQRTDSGIGSKIDFDVLGNMITTLISDSIVKAIRNLVLVEEFRVNSSDIVNISATNLLSLTSKVLGIVSQKLSLTGEEEFSLSSPVLNLRSPSIQIGSPDNTFTEEDLRKGKNEALVTLGKLVDFLVSNYNVAWDEIIDLRTKFNNHTNGGTPMDTPFKVNTSNVEQAKETDNLKASKTASAL